MMRNFNRGQGGRMGGKGGGMGRGKGGMKNRGQGSMMGGQGGMMGGQGGMMGGQGSMMGGQGSMMGGQGGMMGGQGGMRGQGGMGGQGCMMGGQGDMMGGQGDMMGGQGGMMGGQGGMGGHGGMMGGQDGMMGDQGGMMGGQGGMMEGQGGMMGGQGDMMGGQTGMNMMTNQSFGGGSSNQMADNRQTAFVELIQKQSEVIEKLASRVGITNEVKMGAGPMQMGQRGRGGPGMMGPRGHAMGMRGDGPRGPMMPGPFGGMGGGPSGPFQGGPRGPGPFQGGPRGPFYGGPRGPGPFQGGPRGPFQGGNEMNDPKFLKTCQIYLDTMKKNVPSNEDKLSGFCVICSHQSKNNQGFFNHRKNEMHLRQEARIAEMPEKIRRQIDKVVNELYALREKHKYLMYCAVCEEKLPVPYSDHKNMITHTTKARATRAGCRTCKTGPMKTYKQFREHCYTETHIQAAEKFDKKMEDAVEVKDLPPFQDGVVYVKGYIEPTSGYYCSLCRKFLRDDAEMEVHVRLERHFNHVKDEYYNKRKSDTIDWVDYTPVEEDEEEEDGADKTNGSAASEAAMTEEDGKEAKEEEDMETTEQD